MFKLKKSAKRVIGLALVGAMLIGAQPIESYAEENAPDWVEMSVGEACKIKKFGTPLKYSSVSSKVNKSLKGIKCVKEPKGAVTNHSGFAASPAAHGCNAEDVQCYSYYFTANKSEEFECEDETLYLAKRSFSSKYLDMTTSKTNHFPGINNRDKWKIFRYTDGICFSAESSVQYINTLKCKSCSHKETVNNACSDGDKIFKNWVKNSKGKWVVDSGKVAIKDYVCSKCKKKGKWKVSTSLEFTHDGSKIESRIIISQVQPEEDGTAVFANLHFYNYIYASMECLYGGLSSRFPVSIYEENPISPNQCKKVYARVGQKLYYFDYLRTPATLKSSKSSVVSVSSKMKYGGAYEIKAKKKGTATVTATNIFGNKYKFKITVK